MDKRTYSARGLPPGMVIDPSTGVISGMPTASGKYPITVTYTSRSERALRWFLAHWQPVLRVTRRPD